MQIILILLRIVMKTEIVLFTFYFNVIVIEYEIKIKYDPDKVLSYDTVVAIFDKRQVIRGIKKMKYDFKVNRRRLLADNNES